MTRLGILLFAHGARDPAWAQPFEAVARRLTEQASAQGHLVTLAFLEFMSPDILAAGAALAEQGCTEVAVVPLFLGAGGHVRKDLPRLLAELAEAHPGVQWRLSAAVGETDILIQGMADAAWSLAQPGT
ncbi:sirohydrochlorin cobaltochelatase [Aquabacterium commune]|uniref:Sirohydrochlorin cobaltochelatase n=1 Tax=Aquabacterium commune TaxID=70586 RepID=A0A4R6RN66_9BURK|nr:CbiX/SirB N-terminal domain-containing protein [Aquabacterium commune]TDP87992.1 sirohydrochlorin cobaltochelatase [Aquabacterium commune]